MAYKAWVQRPIAQDTVDLYIVRYIDDLASPRQYYHGGIWHFFDRGEIIKPAFSIDGMMLQLAGLDVLADALRQIGDRDVSFLEDVLGPLTVEG